MEMEPTSGDYLNMGHVAMALAQYKEAINFYKLSMNGADGGTEALIRVMVEAKTESVAQLVAERLVKVIRSV